MYVLNQPFDGRGQRLGDVITRLLLQDRPSFTTFRTCVAFVKASGILRLAPALQAFMDRGGQVEMVVGIDEGITTKQALELVLMYSTTAYVFNNPATTFHPKIYLFELPGEKAIAFIGSSNLTVGGLYTNYEACLGLEFDLGIATDQATYEAILAIFSRASDVKTGNARRLDKTLIQELERARRLADETRPKGRIQLRKRKTAIEPDPFPRTPVPPAPPIDPGLVNLIPKIRQTGSTEAVQEANTAFQPWSIFAMVLGRRDTRQTRGYSRDVFIPLAARDANPEFWGWPLQFKSGSDTTIGEYQERRVSLLIRPVSGLAQVIEGVRLYYYDIKHEFRLNCGRLIEGARPGNLLIVQKSPAGISFGGRTYEFEATVIPPDHPAYAAFLRECRYQVKGSSKWWGYL